MSFHVPDLASDARGLCCLALYPSPGYHSIHLRLRLQPYWTMRTPSLDRHASISFGSHFLLAWQFVPDVGLTGRVAAIDHYQLSLYRAARRS